MTAPGFVESVGFADHVNDLNTGNWIVLSGGTAVTLPYLRADYNGIDSATFVKAGKTVNIHSSFTTKSVVYPLTTHPVYMTGDTITVVFKGENILDNVPVDFRLVGGSVSDWKQAYTDLLTNADLTKLKAIIQSPVVPQASRVFNATGDASASFDAPAAGDYMLVAVREVSVPGVSYDLSIYGVTPVEVLDYAMTTTAPSSVNVGDSFGISFTMTGAAASTYRYGAVIISQAAYSLIADLHTTGALSETGLFLNGVLVAQGTGTMAGTPVIDLVGFTLGGLDVNVVTTKTAQIFGASNIAIAFSNPTSSTSGAVSVQTGAGMPSGTYVLLMGVWDSGGNKVVAFKQSTISLTTPPPPPPPTNQAPIASISGPATATEGDSVSFSGAGSSDSDGTLVGYFWDFGDGGSGVGVSASHTYATPGTYTVTLTVTDNKGKTGSATASVRIYSPPPLVDDIKNDTPSDAAAKLEETLPADAAVILNELPAQGAADIMDDLKSDTALKVFAEMNSTNAATIADKMDPEKVGLMIDEGASDGNNTQMAGILLDMNDRQAAEALVDAQPANAAAVIQVMATENLNEAAKTVEEAIKLFIQELDPVLQNEIKKRVKDALEDVSVDSLVSLFIEIANLPNTPSTVAAVLETFDLTKTLNVITGIGAQGAWSELGKIFGYLTTGTLGTIYSAMPVSQRGGVSPYLSAQTVALLPKVGTYQVSALSVTPASVGIGGTTTVTAKVTNVGVDAGTHDVALKVNGATEQTKMVSLNAGASTNVSFTVTKGAAGTYSVAVESQSASFVVVQPKAAAFTLAGLQISKTTANVGEQLTVTVTVSNTGELSGSYPIKVMLDGVEKYSESLTLDGGKSVTKTYTVSSDVAGAHTVAVDGSNVQFTVTTPPPPMTDYTWYIVGGVAVVLVAVAVFFLMKKK